jgi:hypothetical protein
MSVVTNLVIRPVYGYVVTVNGRWISQPPWILPEDPESLTAYWGWLIVRACSEAVELGEEWIRIQLDQAEVPRIGDALLHLLNDFLFGQPNPIFETRELAFRRRHAFLAFHFCGCLTICVASQRYNLWLF